jgi:hypothetical protein
MVPDLSKPIPVPFHLASRRLHDELFPESNPVNFFGVYNEWLAKVNGTMVNHRP